MISNEVPRSRGLLLIGLLAAAASVSCSRPGSDSRPVPSRESDNPVPVLPASPPREERFAVPAVEPALPPEDAQAPGPAIGIPPRAPVAEELPFRVSFISFNSGSARVGVENDEKKGTILKEGEFCWGYQLAGVDREKSLVTFRKDGRDTIVQIRPGTGAVSAARSPTAAADPGKISKPAGMPAENLPARHAAGEFSRTKPPVFEPLPEEIAAGIDPNNAATWPEGYRGPAIERAIKANPQVIQPSPIGPPAE